MKNSRQIAVLGQNEIAVERDGDYWVRITEYRFNDEIEQHEQITITVARANVGYLVDALSRLRVRRRK